MMSFNDYVKFVTQQVVLKMEEPKTEKEDRKAERMPFPVRAFGMIPLGLSIFWRKRVKKRQ
ncbi:YqzE family protein [Halalkalibacter oceani]|uniref:YqzE family protein n=1 Tax=Halalkalibacter oceani TaxID=1653776 RepID=UPI003499660A